MIAPSSHLRLDCPSVLFPSVLHTKTLEAVFFSSVRVVGTLGGSVGWDRALQAGMSWVWFPMVSLGSTQPLIEMGTKNVYWDGEGGRWVGLTPYHLHVPVVSKFGSFKLQEPSLPVIGLCRGKVTFIRALIIAHVIYFDFINIIKLTKWRVWWAGHVAVERWEIHMDFQWEHLKGRKHLKVCRVDHFIGTIIIIISSSSSSSSPSSSNRK